MKETAFNNKFVAALRQKYPNMYAKKIHGHDMQESGIPDNLFCINGVFVGIEFKVQRDGRVSITKSFKQQVRDLNQIKDANGIGLLIAYDEGRNKILVRTKRLDWRKLKSKIDWDFEFSHYEKAIDIVHLMIEGV